MRHDLVILLDPLSEIAHCLDIYDGQILSYCWWFRNPANQCRKTLATSCKWSYNPYKWPYKWATGGYNPTYRSIGVISYNPFITGRGPPCTNLNLINSPDSRLPSNCVCTQGLWRFLDPQKPTQKTKPQQAFERLGIMLMEFSTSGKLWDW